MRHELITVNFKSSVLIKWFPNLVFFYKYLSYRILALVAVSFLVGALDGLGLAMFIPILSMASEGMTETGYQQMGALAFLPKSLQYLGFNFSLPVVLCTMLFFFILKGIAKLFQNYLQVIFQQLFVLRLRFDAIDALKEYSYDAFVKADVGKMHNTFSGEVAKISQAYRNYNIILQGIMLLIIYVLMALLANMQFTILIILGGTTSSLLFKLFYTRTKIISKKLYSQNNSYQGLLLQNITFFKYLKATGRISEYSIKLKDRIKDILKSNRKIGVLNSMMIASQEPIMIIIIVGAILIQTYWFGGSLTTILVSLLFFYRGLSELTKVQNAHNSFMSFSGSLEGFQEFLADLKHNRESIGKTIVDGFKERLLLDNVSFAYRGRDMVLKNISLSIPKNETVALVGESGSGKTTLTNIISGLLSPLHGRLWIDNLCSNEINRMTFQNCIGYITQEPVIFDDTIYNNVTFWADKNEKNEKRFNEALRKSQISEFVETLLEGENTRLGNNGIALSGGQKQRISIARELYKDVDLLIMDEATSSLDSETEAMIQQNIDALKGKLTIVIVAHRLSTIKNADTVVVMSKGQIEQTGTYEGLINTSPLFKKMVSYQEL